MTLKEYLEKQIRFWADELMNLPDGHPLRLKYSGKVESYQDVLLQCPDSVLDKRILENVW